MKKIIISSAILVAFLSSAFTISMLWKADKKTSTVNFELPESDKKGTFSNLTSVIDFDAKNLNTSKITASIDVATIKAGDEKLEKHLLSADFFDAIIFKKITFTSTEITNTATGFLAKGNLTMKDSTKLIELPFTFTESANDKATFSGTMSINAGDYGVIKGAKAGSDKVLIYLVVPVTK